MKILVIDVGGTHVKLLAPGRRLSVSLESGPTMTPRRMVQEVLAAAAGSDFDHVAIGFPGPVRDDRPTREPWNLGRGWVGFDFRKAFGVPVRLINDASMQALGSYQGRNMLFLGLGTGLGSTMIRNGMLIPLELARLPYRHGKSYEEYLGAAGYARLGKSRWRKHVLDVVGLFVDAFEVDYVVLGGGNAKHMKELPVNVRIGSNANAFKGGRRLWS
jgi:polyphosphate glucokinase